MGHEDPMGRVLVVDDEQGLRDVIEVLLCSKGHTVATAESEAVALQMLQNHSFDLVITDLRIEPDGDGIQVLKAARAVASPAEVIVMTAYGTREKAQEAVAQGAAFYLEKGPHLATDIEVLATQAIKKRQLESENQGLRRALTDRYSTAGLIGQSEPMREVLDLVERVGPLRATVLISGESGTGKERVARALHHASPWAKGPFIPLNCGAIPETLLESELFGHAKGAFTGADNQRQGLFEAAKGGTIFLDEIGEMPISMQPKLLRVLQERSIKRVGAVEELSVEDVRVIAASNRDLEAEVSAGRFREDLYFRLNVIQLELPPLRERLDDIPLLINAFLDKYNQEYGRSVTRVAPSAMKALLAFRFPGNVRQLQNVIERGVALSTGPELGIAQLPKSIGEHQTRPEPPVSLAPEIMFPEQGVDLETLVEDYENRLISAALEKSKGVKTRAAELLGLSFRQFRYKLSKYSR